MITISDDARSNVSILPALVVGTVVVLGFGLTPLGSHDSQLTDATQRLIEIFLIGWPVYALVYLLWTHAGLKDLTESELVVHSRWAIARRRQWLSILFGSGGAVSWTIIAASVAILLNVYLITVGDEASGMAAVLGLANVVASWAVMVYSFALEYMRLDLREGGSSAARQLEFDMGGDRVFGDYLTFSVLSSTMTAALPGKAITRAGWRLVRTNVIVAFAFNSVVVATLVSMILSSVTM
ncbi:DUF1345 domain-containing protein [Brevibacterium casei]|uniref:DUF1345 domain-containing protein n=2 Tax=Brevibacterium casei TaxID=33889 RepID=A0AB34XUZ1_9MICO|nr:hypothetical protein AVW13_04915 [Brevibacterium casei]